MGDRSLVRSRTALAGAIVPAAVLGVAAWTLLSRSLFGGMAQSFDAMLYARELWGAARLDFWNPVVNLHSFAVHGHFLVLPLAPLTYVIPAAKVLILAQAAALAATTTLVARGVQHALVEHGATSEKRVAWTGVWAVGVAVLGAPVVLNPFLFDVRPDMLGVPFATAALLRGVRRGGLDWRAAALMVPAILAREEFALVAACGLVLAPGAGAGAEGPNLSRVHRWVLAAGAVALFALYFFGVRVWLGGSDASSDAHMSGENASMAAPAWDVLLKYKAELAFVIAAGGGGLGWLGWRWAGAALFGVGFLFVSKWMPEFELNFHYGMFAAPGLLAATVAGYRAWLARGAKRPVALYGVAATLAVVCYSASASAPGGHRFLKRQFDMVDEEGNLRLSLGAHVPGYAETHKRLREIPELDGVVVPWEFAAPLADRPFIWRTNTLVTRARLHKSVPSQIKYVVVLKNERKSLGRWLVRHGFRLAGYQGGRVEVLTRDTRQMQTPWDTFAQRGAPRGCRSPARWPEAGLAFCGFVHRKDGVMGAWFVREATVPGEDVRASVRAAMRKSGSDEAETLWFLDGLLDLADLPVGYAMIGFPDKNVPDGWVPVLATAGGRVIPRAPRQPSAAAPPNGVQAPVVGQARAVEEEEL